MGRHSKLRELAEFPFTKIEPADFRVRIASAPPQMRHYGQCKGDSILQVNGIAPFLVTFVSPDDTGSAKKP